MENVNALLEFFINVSSKKILALLMALFILVIAFPIIDSNFLYFSRLDKRVDILNRVSELDYDAISSNDTLKEEYENIINEIKKFDDNNLINTNNIFNERTLREVKIWKVLSGGIIFIVLIPFALFSKKDSCKIKSNKVALLLVMAIIGCLVGFILPTFRVHEINYIGVPIFEFTILYFINNIRLNSKNDGL